VIILGFWGVGYIFFVWAFFGLWCQTPDGGEWVHRFMLMSVFVELFFHVWERGGPPAPSALGCLFLGLTHQGEGFVVLAVFLAGGP